MDRCGMTGILPLQAVEQGQTDFLQLGALDLRSGCTYVLGDPYTTAAEVSAVISVVHRGRRCACGKVVCDST